MKNSTLGDWGKQIKRILLWDVGKYFATFRSFIPSFGSRHKTQNHRTRWRVTTWWPNESRIVVQKSLLRILIFAHQHQLELPRIVRNFANEHRGLRRLRLLTLSKRLAKGLPLVEAVEQTPGVLNEQNVLALRFASQLGVFNHSFCDQIQSSDRDREIAMSGLARVSLYALAMLLVMALYLGFTGSFIGPRLMGLANEYGMASSWPTFLKSVYELGGDYIAWAIGLLGLGTMVLLFSSQARRYLSKRFRRLYSWLGLSSHTAELLALLSHAAEQGRPISGSLSTLARYHYDRLTRQQLLFIRNEVEQGADVWACFCDAKFITDDEASAIRQCPDSRSQGWLLRQLSESRDAIITARYRMLTALAHPLVTIVFALLIGVICFAQFQFLTDLISVTQR
jgi:type II secretory pathway component PulF